ncbi:MAG: hypothetical protein ABJB55_04760 [Actinomycetota bacterium]
MLLLTAGTCSVDATSTPSPRVSGSLPDSVAMPNVRLPGLHRSDATLGAADAAADATHPDSMAAILSGAGLVAVRERTYTGSAHGAFARVVIRAWVFTSGDGAGSFFDWVRVNASHELIGEASPLHRDIPGDAFVMLHEPSGCCHEETPIYLAVWQRHHTVWTVRASGPRIETAPVLALVRSIEQEV